ncbi:MAG: nucleoside monophosphate kinase [bacterium]
MKAICKKIPRTLLFLGLAGSGKSTQADLICNPCEGENISTGDLARNERKNKTKLGKMADKYMEKGLLIPDKVIHKILRAQLTKFNRKKLWAFTGTVRTTNQIPMFDETLAVFNRELDKVVFLELTDESIINRLSKRRFCPKCNTNYHPDYKKSKKDGICDKDEEKLIQREDDKPDIIRTRIEVERKVIEPVLSEYERRGILLRINGEPSIEEIHKVLVKRLADEG